MVLFFLKKAETRTENCIKSDDWLRRDCGNTVPKGINSSQAEGLGQDDTLNRAGPPSAASAHRRSNPPFGGESLRSKKRRHQIKGTGVSAFCIYLSQDIQEVTL